MEWNVSSRGRSRREWFHGLSGNVLVSLCRGWSTSRQDVTAQDPYIFEDVHSAQLVKDELKSHASVMEGGYTEMKAGSIGFSLFFVGDEF